ncbi:MAG TPA: TylF/MycF/NovP-related O-methyltransferase [Bacteroidales bacterium]|nr:TylF/MycF/NovP-related O-methyltransferase [Bacteroidales bacterium]
MNTSLLFNILEVALLAGVFIFLFRFVFSNYSSKVRKPASWVNAVKEGRISAALLHAEKKYSDRIRFYNIWIQIRRINSEKVEGSFAELGVYKGETARIIHLSAPERKLHLFDTFEGFPPGDLKDESGKAAAYTSMHFADTSAEKVMGQFKDQSNIVIHKGYFPETTRGLESEKFAFVSLDADLELPTRSGLEFFYPRLSAGGVILIHDYHEEWPGLMRTVDAFCKDHNLPVIPLPDADSSVMIIKGTEI